MAMKHNNTLNTQTTQKQINNKQLKIYSRGEDMGAASEEIWTTLEESLQ